MFRRSRRPIVAIAIFAILLNAFAPAVARALAPLGPGEICSAQSTADAGQHAPADKFLQQHCLYCAPHAGSFGLPPPAALSVATGGAGTSGVGGEAVPAPARAAWSTAQPRAPPFPG
jgi:hypothetical protein